MSDDNHDGAKMSHNWDCPDECRETYLAMLQAFSDENDRQRESNGWQRYPLPPVVEWPVAEQDAGIAALRAAFTVQEAMKMRDE